MNWDALGALAELVGALGVIVSLLYLATQIRVQNRESRVSASRELSSSFNDFLGDMARDSVLAEIFIRGLRDMGSLDEVELMQFSSHMNRVFRVFESMHLQNLEGRLDSSVWRGVANILKDYSSQKGFRDWWSTRRHWYSNDFQIYVDPLMEGDT